MTYRSMQADVVSFTGHNGDKGEAYYARPSGAGPTGSSACRAGRRGSTECARIWSASARKPRHPAEAGNRTRP